MQIYGLCFIEYGVKPIPLRNVVVEANVVDMIAEVTISQTYKNFEKNTIEAFYKFPIYEAAAVCGFEAEIDGQRKIKGIVKESKEAAKEYTEAVQKGHGAYLLESESANVFQCSVGNITSGQTVVIKITYVTELKHDSETEKIRFVLPTHIAPRYGSSEYSSSSNDGKILNPDAVSYSNRADFYLDLTVTCRMTSTIQNIESPSHKISTEMNIDENPKISKITLTEQITYLEKDFILVVKSKDLNQPRAFVEYNPETQTNCVMLTLVPTFALNATMSELIFVVDRSGSMGIEPMKKAAQALELLLHSLPEDCYFNVVSFGTRHDPLFPKSQLYSETTLSQALNLAQIMTANYGGTEVFSALKWTFENSRNDMPTSVFFITDGGVWNVDQIVELVRENEEKKKDDLRFFSLGIGDSVSYNLVESVARAGKGYAQFVTNNERIDKKIIGMLKNALKPPIKDYNITWANHVEPLEEKELDVTPMEIDKPTISFMSDENMELQPPSINIFTDIKVQQAPYLIPPIYSGIRFIVYCILEKNIEPCKVISLKATSQDGPMKLDIPLDPITLQGSKIHRLAARKLIQDLDDKKSFIHKHPKNADKHIPTSFVKKHIVNLGKTYNLASKYTSFIAIDEKNNETIAPESQAISQKRTVPQFGGNPNLFGFGSVRNLSNLSSLATTQCQQVRCSIQPNSFSQSQTASLFGQPNQPSLFGQTVVQQSRTSQTGFGFGGQPSLFCQSSQPNPFLQSQPNQPSSFGQPNQPSLFGQTVVQPSQTGFGGFGFGGQHSLFCQSSQPNPFLQSQPNQPSSFGQPNQPSLFGQTVVQQSRTSQTGFGFGGQPSLFGQSSQPSLFGQLSNSQTPVAFGSSAQSPSLVIKNSNINHKESQIENLFEFLRLQSFNGKFLPNKSFYEFFYKNDLNDLINLKQEIEKELSESSEKEIEDILINCIAIAYLKIIMFNNFKDECEMCYEKVEKVLKKMIENNEKEKIIIEKAEEWIKNWVNNNS